MNLIRNMNLEIIHLKLLSHAQCTNVLKVSKNLCPDDPERAGT